MKYKRRLAAGLLTAALIIGGCALPAAAAENAGVGVWEEVFETVHHGAEGHFERKKTGEKEVIDKEAWDESIEIRFYECTVCGFRSYDSGTEIDDHVLFEHPTGSGQHYYDPVDGIEIYPSYREKTEYRIVHHDAEVHMEDVYEDIWVEDREAYDEFVPTGVYRYVVGGYPMRNRLVSAGGATYYLDSNGVPVTGWHDIKGRRYYFADERWKGYKKALRGKMLTGWKTISGRVYYFMDKRCAVYSKAKEGSMLTGWKTISGRKYYFTDKRYSSYRDVNKGVMLTGLRKIGGKKYFFYKNGVMAANRFVRIKGKKYYFSNSGAMRKLR